jgi:hypothetical protein
VKHVDALRPTCEVDHPKSARRLTNANLSDARADCGHWLPIMRLLATLNLLELIARRASGISRKADQILSTAAHPYYWFHRRDYARYSIVVQLASQRVHWIAVGTRFLLRRVQWQSVCKVDSSRAPANSPQRFENSPSGIRTAIGTDPVHRHSGGDTHVADDSSPLSLASDAAYVTIAVRNQGADFPAGFTTRPDDDQHLGRRLARARELIEGMDGGFGREMCRRAWNSSSSYPLRAA